jgi:xanthosine utilization system XapX-like protein
MLLIHHSSVAYIVPFFFVKFSSEYAVVLFDVDIVYALINFDELIPGQAVAALTGIVGISKLIPTAMHIKNEVTFLIILSIHIPPSIFNHNHNAFNL